HVDLRVLHRAGPRVGAAWRAVAARGRATNRRTRYRYMGGPEMAPQTPQCSSRLGGPGALLDFALSTWGPEMAPQIPQRSGRPGKAVTPLDPPTLEAATRGRSAPG